MTKHPRIATVQSISNTLSTSVLKISTVNNGCFNQWVQSIEFKEQF